MSRHATRALREHADAIRKAFPIHVRLRFAPGCDVRPDQVRLWMEAAFRNPADAYMDGHVMVCGLSDGGQARHLADTWAHLLDARPDLIPPGPRRGPPSADFGAVSSQVHIGAPGCDPPPVWWTP